MIPQMLDLNFEKFVKKDGNGFDYVDRHSLAAYLDSFDEIQSHASNHDGLHVAIGMFQIWQCSKGFAVAALISGSYLGHRYFTDDPTGLKEVIEYCFNAKDLSLKELLAHEEPCGYGT